MKASKKIVGATAALVAAVALSAGSTFAWFSSNSTVTASGMLLEVKTPNELSLVINNSKTWGSSLSNAVNFADPTATSLTPCTRYEAAMESAADTPLTASSSGLVYVNNPGDVDFTSGLAEAGKELYYSAAVNATGATYYKDYVLWIACSDAAKEVSNFTIQATAAVKDSSGTTVDSIYKALAIDVYYDADSTVADANAAISDLSLNKNNWTLATSVAYANAGSATTIASSGLTIPKYNSGDEGQLVLILRVYMDGEYGSDTSSAYVNSNSVSTQDIVLSVSFSAEAVEETA